MEINQNPNPATGERTFTQEEVNRIIGERLAKEKNKGDSASAEREQQLAQREQQLAKRELLFNAKEKIDKMGLPADLVNVLDVSNPEALDKALLALEQTIDEKTRQKSRRIYETHKLPEGSQDLDEPVDRQIRQIMGLSV